jgi:hypothetical protein
MNEILNLGLIILKGSSFRAAKSDSGGIKGCTMYHAHSTKSLQQALQVITFR